MYVKYSLYFWNPPILTPQQEIEVGRMFTEMGREAAIKRAPYLAANERAHMAAAQHRTAGQWAILMLIAVAFFGGCAWVIVSNRVLLVTFGIALIPLLAFSLPTLLSSRRRYERWVDLMMARYVKALQQGKTDA